MCGLRVFWIYAVLPIFPGLDMLYYSYPVSWVLTGACHLICALILMKKKFPVNLALEAEA